MTDEETLALRPGDLVEHRGYPGLRMEVRAVPRLGWPDYVKPGPPVLLTFEVKGILGEPAAEERAEDADRRRRLESVEALIAGATTDGEREAAEAARGRILAALPPPRVEKLTSGYFSGAYLTRIAGAGRDLPADPPGVIPLFPVRP